MGVCVGLADDKMVNGLSRQTWRDMFKLFWVKNSLDIPKLKLL